MSSARYRSKVVPALLVVAAISGCAGNGNGLDANGNPPGSGGGSGSSGPLTADFKSIQDNIFTPICSRCHIGASAPETLQLDAAHSYSSLVGIPSKEQPGVQRVEAGDPDSSYIIRKLEGDPSISGDRMPFGGPYLSQATIDIIKQWIQAGAQNSAGATSLEASIKAVQRFGIASTSPDDASIVSDSVQQIIVSFNADIDSTLLNSTTVTLARADGTPLIPVSIKVPTGDPSAILIKPQTPLTNGTYRVTLQGSLANMNAQALGQDSSFTFTVDMLP